MHNKLRKLSSWYSNHEQLLLRLGLLCALSFFAYGALCALKTWRAAREQMAMISSAMVASSSVSAPAIPVTDSMKNWVLSVVKETVAATPLPPPQVTTIIKTVPVAVASNRTVVTPPSPAAIVNNYYSYPSTVINNNSTVAASNTTNLTTDANLDGSLSVAGLLTLNGGLNLNGGLLSSNALNFNLPSISDTLVGLNDAGTLVNKTISGTANTITDLGITNFATQNISQWTNDVGLIAANSTDTLLHKTISGVDNIFENIPNSATTASALNAVNSIVTRDANGDFAAGAITANLIGNAATATSALTADVADTATTATTALIANLATTATLADTVLNGVYTTGSYVNPSWLSSVDGSKLTGTILANAIAPGTYAVDIAGNAATATNAVLATTATTANSVLNGIYTTGSYANPSWLTSLDGSKLAGTVTANAITAGNYAINILGNAATANTALSAANATLADTATTANSVLNGVYTTGSYANPSWITSINGNKLVGTITANALAAGTYAANITGNAATASLADSVTNGLYSTGTYVNPTWLSSIDGSKLTGTVLANAVAAGTYAIGISGNAATANLATTANSVLNGVYTTGTYANPSWITSLNGNKLVGTITANALAAGSYTVDITGNAATATSAVNAASADVATTANSVLNGVYTTGSYANPTWITNLNGNKLVGTVTANAITAGTYAINVSGNAATASLADVATLANNATTVTNGLYSTGNYMNPSWITSLNGSKLIGTVTANAIASGSYAIDVTGNASTVTSGLYSTGSYSNPTWLTSLDGSKLAGTVTANAISAGTYAIGITGNAATATLASTVTNGVYTTGSYANPAWLTSLDGAKLAGTITANAIAAGTYAIGISGNAATVTNGIYSNGSYSNPSWLTSIDGSKLGGTVTANAIAAGTYGISVTGNAATATLASAVTDGVYTTGSYANPSWISSLNGSKLVGTVTANAITAGSYAIDIAGNAATATLAASATNALAVTNGLYSTGTYANPSWLVSLDGSKLAGTITANAVSVGTYAIGITGNAATATNATTVTNGIYTTGSYSNPSWLTGLDGSKLSGTITANALAAGTYAANISGNAATVTNGLYTTGTYSNPSWLTGLDGSKLTGTITANALVAGDYTVNNLTTANTVVASGTLANTLLSGTCIVNTNALGLAAFQSSATVTTGQIFYNATRNRHSRITSVSTCTDSGNAQWRIISLTDSVTGSAAGDSYTIYNPTGSIGNTGAGFFNNFYAINLKGLVSTLSGGFDVAEQYQTVDDNIEPGDVVSLDPDHPGYIKKSSSPYESGVIGTIATNPGLTLGNETVGTWKKVALSGHVPMKVSTENGAIAIGDFLTTSSQSGIAMKATGNGVVIGKAMESYDTEGVGLIQAFVNISSYTAPHVSMKELTQSIQDNAVTVDSKVLFNGGIVTDTIAANADALTLLNDTIFIGRPYFNTDTAGFALIKHGSTSVSVTYDAPYLETPIVNVTITENGVADTSLFNVRYVVSNNTPHGFTILTSAPVSSDIRFSWTAFMVKGAKTATSVDQTTSPVVQEVSTQTPETDSVEVLPPSEMQSPEVLQDPIEIPTP